MASTPVAPAPNIADDFESFRAEQKQQPDIAADFESFRAEQGKAAPAPSEPAQPKPDSELPDWLRQKVTTARANIAKYPENQPKASAPQSRLRMPDNNVFSGKQPAPVAAEGSDLLPSPIQTQAGKQRREQLIDQSLATANKYAVEPFDRMSAAGARGARTAGDYLLANSPSSAASGLVPPGGPAPNSGKPAVTSPEVAAQLKTMPPALVGTTRAITSTAGGMVADPRQWPLIFAGGTGAGARAMSAGFGLQMAHGTVKGAQELQRVWNDPSVPPEQKYEMGASVIISALMTGAAVKHAAAPRPFEAVSPDDPTQVMKRHMQANGELPPDPPPAAEPKPQLNLDAEEIGHISGLLAQLPHEGRQGILVSLHPKLAELMLKAGTFTGPDGKLHIVETPEQASKLSQQFINDSVDAHDKRITEQQKQTEAAQKAREKQEQGKPSAKAQTPQGSTAAQRTRQFIQQSRPQSELQPRTTSTPDITGQKAGAAAQPPSTNQATMEAPASESAAPIGNTERVYPIGPDESSSPAAKEANRKVMSGEELTPEERSLSDRQGRRLSQLVALKPQDAAQLNSKDFRQWESHRVRERMTNGGDLFDVVSANLSRGDIEGAESLLKLVAYAREDLSSADFPDETATEIAQRNADNKARNATLSKDWKDADELVQMAKRAEPSRIQRLRDRAAKADTQSEATTDAPVSGKPGPDKGMTTDTAAVQNVVENADMHPDQQPAVMVKEEPPKQTAALEKAPEPVSPKHVQRIGKEDKESERTILQPSDDVMQNERLAGEAAPELATKLSEISASVPGAKFDRLRPQKELERVDEKVQDSGKPPETVPDYLAAQIAADSPQAKDQLIAELHKHFPVVKVEDNFLEGKKELANYRSANIQVGMGNGVTAEIQIVPREQQEIANQSHVFYSKGREAELRGDHAEKERQFAKAAEMHDVAMAKFNQRNEIGEKSNAAAAGAHSDIAADFENFRSETAKRRDPVTDISKVEASGNPDDLKVTPKDLASVRIVDLKRQLREAEKAGQPTAEIQATIEREQAFGKGEPFDYHARLKELEGTPEGDYVTGVADNAKLSNHEQARSASGEVGATDARAENTGSAIPEGRSGQRASEPGTPASEAGSGVPEKLPRGQVGEVPASDLTLDPKRFQYKLNTDSTGVTNLLKGQKFNPDLAGVIQVWRDPEDGKLYVVNGHHRAQLAKESNQPSMLVRHLDVPTAEAARARGALTNIAEGRGTALDAAKFFRDSGVTPEHLSEEGISMGEATASNGLALSRLDPFIFEHVATGQIPEGRGIAIGKATDDPAQQEAILKLVDKAEAKGKRVSNDTVSELARFVSSSGSRSETTQNLFGSQTEVHSNALEKAEISAYVKSRIGFEKKTFGSVAKESKAQELSRGGNKINVKENERISREASQAEELYNTLSSRTGTVNDILEKAARRLASGENPSDIKSQAYSAIRKELAEAISGRTDSSAEGLQAGAGRELSPEQSAPNQTVGLFGSAPIKGKPSERGFAVPAAVNPVILAADSLKYAAASVKDFVTETRDNMATSRKIEDGLFRLDKQYEADVLRARDLMIDAKASPEDKEAVYHHLEDPSLPLTDRQKDILESYVKPLMDQSAAIRAKLNEEGIPATNEGYVHRVVQGKSSQLERAASGKSGSGKGSVLNQSASSLKGRTMMSLEAEDSGRRMVVAIKGDHVTGFTRGRAVDMGRLRSGMTTKFDLLDEKLEPLANKIIDLKQKIEDFPESKRAAKIASINDQLEELEKQRETLDTVKGRTRGQNSVYGVEPTFNQRKAITQQIDALQSKWETIQNAKPEEFLSDAEKDQLRRLNESLTVAQNERGRILERLSPSEFENKVWVDRNGKKWKITQATTKEIEAHTDLKYYKDGIASAVTDYLQLRRAERAHDYLESLKQDPEFQKIAIESKDGATVPDGYERVDLPQFRNYAFQKHTAEVLNRYSQELRRGSPGVMEKIAHVVQTSMLFNPVVHPLNVLNHAIVEKGLIGSLDARNWPIEKQAALKAIEAVWHQNDDFKEALDNGAPLMSHRDQVGELNSLFFKNLADETAKNPKMDQFMREYFGTDETGAVATGKKVVSPLKMIYDLSRSTTWLSNDALFLQSAYTKHLKGMPLDQAFKETAKHIPDYRIPTRVLNSPLLSSIMRNRLISAFSAYHYGQLRSYGEMVKEAYKGVAEKDPTAAKKAAKKAADHLLMLGLLTLSYSAVDEALKKFTGRGNATIRRPGASTLPYAMYEMAQGRKDPASILTSIITPSAFPKAVVETGLDRDLATGREVYDPHSSSAKIAEDIAAHLGASVAPEQMRQKFSRSSTPWKDFAWSTAGVTFPKNHPRKHR